MGRLTAQGLYNICTPVTADQAKPGDLVFFVGTYDTPGVSHVGLYVGNSVMLHCGDPISYTNLNSSYWQQHLYCYGVYPDARKERFSMATNKLDRIERDIEKTKTKIAELQKQLRELEAAKTEQENLQIVQLVRGLNMTPQEFAAFVRGARCRYPRPRSRSLNRRQRREE